MSKLNELAVIDPMKVQIVPNADELAYLRDELRDMDRPPFGRIQIAAGGAGVFKVTEPGEEDATPATEIRGVIIYTHKANALWPGEFGKSDDKTPLCASVDGKEGYNTETGEWINCETCSHNQYGSARQGSGRGKACKNMRRLYILRPGDMLPLMLPLPPSALAAYDKYRTRIMLGRKPVYGVVTKITLKNRQNNEGVDYSTPVFDPVAVLTPGDAERVKQYAEEFGGAAQNAGITSDDYMTAEQPVDSEFTDVGDDELPDFGGKAGK